MRDTLKLFAGTSTEWDTAGAGIPVSKDAEAETFKEQCGVVTKDGPCKSKCQDLSLACPTHTRLIKKYTRKYHTLPNLLDNASTIESAKKMLRYIVALRTVVYIMYQDASKHKEQKNDKAKGHMKVIHYFERLLHMWDLEDVETFVQFVRLPDIDDMKEEIPTSLTHLFKDSTDGSAQTLKNMFEFESKDSSSLFESTNDLNIFTLLQDTRLTEDLAHDATAVDIFSHTRPGGDEQAATLQPEWLQDVLVQGNKGRREAELTRVDETSFDIMDPLDIWVEFLSRIDRGQDVVALFNTPYDRRNPEDRKDNKLGVSAVAFIYLFDAPSGKHTISKEVFYGTDKVFLKDLQVLPMVWQGVTWSKDANPSEKDTKNGQFLFTGRTPDEHLAFREFVIDYCMKFPQFFPELHRKVLRGLLEVKERVHKEVPVRLASRNLIIARRFLNIINNNLVQSMTSELENTFKKIQNRRGVAELKMRDPKIIAENCFTKNVSMDILRCQVRCLTLTTFQTLGDVQLNSQKYNWWGEQPMGTVSLSQKFLELKVDNDKVWEPSGVTNAIYEDLFNTFQQYCQTALHEIKRLLIIEMTKHREKYGDLPPVLSKKEIEELNKQRENLAKIKLAPSSTPPKKSKGKGKKK